MANQHVLYAARLMVQSGVSVIPIRPVDDRNPKGKEPLVKWEPYQTRLPTDDEMVRWFNSPLTLGLAVIGGIVSGNLEILDFDESGLFTRFTEILPADLQALLKTLPVVLTPSGAHHLYYRCETPVDGNRNLAHTLGPDGKLLDHGGIQTRGEKGYALCPPTPSVCHPAGISYGMLRGSPACIPTITTEQRSVLLDTARSFNQYTPLPKWDPKHETEAPRLDGETTPWHDYNSRRGLVQEVLVKHGWRMVIDKGEEGSEWLRPGKQHGRGSGGLDYRDGFKCFTSNAPPFEMEGRYAPFDVYKILEHDGNGTEAGAALGKIGFGCPPKAQANGLNGHHKNGSTPIQTGWRDMPDSESADLIPFPLDALPDVLRIYVESVARTTEVPVDLIAMSAIGVCSAAIRGRAYVQVGVTHKENLSLYIMPLMATGLRKTAALEHLSEPVFNFQDSLRISTSEENEKVKAKAKRTKRAISRLEQELKKTSLSAQEIDELDRKVLMLENEVPPIRPKPQIIVDDITPESLAAVMSTAEDNSMCVMSAEGKFFANLSGIYNGGRPNLDIALKAYGGERMSINRKGQVVSEDGEDGGEIMLHRPTLNFVTIVQPAILRDMLKTRAFRELGFVGRCLFVYNPSPEIGLKYKGIPIDDFAYGDYEMMLSQLLNMQLMATKENRRKRIEISLIGEGLDIWARYFEIVNEMRLDTLLLHDDWAAKHAGRAARIAGVLHLVKHATIYANATSTPISSFEDMASDTPISAETMRQAVQIAEYAIPQTLAALGITRSTERDQSIKLALKVIANINKPQIAAAEIAAKIKGETPDALRGLVEYICKCGYLRPVAERPGMFDVNPAILTQKKGKQNA